MHKPEPPVIEPFTFVFSWRRFLIHCLIMGFCIMLGLLTWYFGKPHSIRFYETKSEQNLVTSLTSEISMVLDLQSSVAIKEGEPLQVEVFKGNVYFDVQQGALNKLEIKVGSAMIKDTGTRFSIRMHKDGTHNIAVADGHIKIHMPSGIYQINALEQADFDETGIKRHRLLDERNIAPWNH